jgi:hypothetical protein
MKLKIKVVDVSGDGIHEGGYGWIKWSVSRGALYLGQSSCPACRLPQGKSEPAKVPVLNWTCTKFGAPGMNLQLLEARRVTPSLYAYVDHSWRLEEYLPKRTMGRQTYLTRLGFWAPQAGGTSVYKSFDNGRSDHRLRSKP